MKASTRLTPELQFYIINNLIPILHKQKKKKKKLILSSFVENLSMLKLINNNDLKLRFFKNYVTTKSNYCT